MQYDLQDDFDLIDVQKIELIIFIVIQCQIKIQSKITNNIYKCGFELYSLVITLESVPLNEIEISNNTY